MNLDTVIASLPFIDSSPFLSSLIVLLAFILIERTVTLTFTFIIRRVTGRTKTTLDDKLFAVLQRTVFWIVLLFGLYVALLPLGLTEETLHAFRRVLLSLGYIVVGLGGIGILSVATQAFEHGLETHRLPQWADMLPFVQNIIRLGVLGIVVVAILGLWSINIAPIMASAGVLGIAVAFAARDTVANLFGGLSVFFDKPYKIGDYVIINDKYRGEVIDIGMRSTKIRTRDYVLLTVPNSVLVTSAVINETGFDPQLRIRIPVSVAYESDLEKVEKLLVGVFVSHKDIIKNYKPRVRYRSFEESYVALEVLGIIAKPADRGRVMHELIKSITATLKKHKIHTPYPRRDVHLMK